MIKFTKRRNIFYIIQLVIWSNLRTLIKMLLKLLYNFKKSSLSTILMFFGEFTSGSIVYKYQSKYLRKKENDVILSMIKKNNLSFEKNKSKPNKLTVFFLLFIATYLDFVEFIIHSFYIQSFNFISSSLNSRFYSFLVICNALGYRYLLKFKIHKHQILSLIIIFVCFIITISTEYIFQNINEIFTYGEFTLSLGLILFQYFYLSLMDIIDKYLLEFESTDPFFIIMIEGLIGLIFGIGFCFVENPFPELKYIYESKSTISFIFFIFLLFLFYLFTALRAAFRIMINKLYSPMELTLSDYFLNPFYIIFNYINGDFKSKNGQNIAYFVLNLILSSLTAFSAFIYNEFIVLFCFGFERNTYDQITKRSFDEKVEMRIYDSINEVSKETEEEEDDEIEDKKDKFEKNDSFKIYV